MTSRGGKRGFLLFLCLFGALLFTGLGVWQVQRLFWKLDLVERVNARLHTEPVPPPPGKAWPSLDRRAFEYRHVRVQGAYLHDRETLIDALTERGPGYWVVTPLRTPDGIVLINRGFVPPERKTAAKRPVGQIRGLVSITGLMRSTEAKGRFLRPNRPAQDLWYSRDVAAIAQARGLPNTAPFFIDADATANAGGFPIGGMTVVHFRNAHLVYALTWFALAALCTGGLLLLGKSRQKAG